MNIQAKLPVQSTPPVARLLTSERTLATVIERVGTDQFHENVMLFLTSQVPVDIEWIVHYSPLSIPKLIHSRKLEHAKHHIDLNMVNKLYYDGYYRLDPWYRYWRNDGRVGVLTPNTLGPIGESKEDFYSVLKPFLGDMDVIAIFFPCLGRSAITVFLEREETFSVKEIDYIKDTFPELLALQNLHEQIMLGTIRSTHIGHDNANIYMLIEKSSRCLYESKGWKNIANKDTEFTKIATALAKGPTPRSINTKYGVLHFERIPYSFLSDKEARLLILERSPNAKSAIGINNALNNFHTDELTPRERQIIRLIILGYSSEKIAKELGIGVGTIRNHRKRLYHKLDIAAERELFSKFLTFLDEHFL